MLNISVISSFLSTAVLTVILIKILIINVSAVNFKQSINNTNSSVIYFNNLYLSSIYEKKLSISGQCRGDCAEIFQKEYMPNYREIREKCFGELHACLPIFSGINISCQLCACLCERTFDPPFQTIRGKLLDSFCLDPVSVDPGYVATGVRFKVRENRIHVELQQGKFQNGRIIKETISWKFTENCSKSKKVIDNFNGWEYDSIKIKLEDIILPAMAVVTGVTFTKSLQGKYLDVYKNIDEQSSEIFQPTQCDDSVSEMEYFNLDQLIDVYDDYHDSDTWNVSQPCQHNVSFRGSSFIKDYTQHVIPFIDLQEIVTDPPQPIRGIGWYLQNAPNFNELLSLRIL